MGNTPRIGKTCALIILNIVHNKSQLSCTWTMHGVTIEVSSVTEPTADLVSRQTVLKVGEQTAR